MLGGTILRAIFMWILIIILIQPILSHKDYLIDANVKANASFLAQKAAPEGRVTSELYNEVIQNLTDIGLTEGQIKIEFNNILHQRGEVIDVIIKVERKSMFVFNFSGVDTPEYYYGRHRVMSEYID